MKKIIILYSLFLFIGCNTPHASKEEKLLTLAGQKWHTNLNLSMLKAKKENKNLLVMVSEDYCRWCLKMENETLSQIDIQKKLKDYILVSLKRSDKESVKQLSGFDGNIPSFFFIEPNTDFMESIIGYYEAPVFLDYLIEIENDR